VAIWFEYAPLAFPSTVRAIAQDAARGLQPFVDESYRVRLMELTSCGRPVKVPSRVNFIATDIFATEASAMGVMAHCLCTRSTDGYVRQKALQRIIHSQECWAIPFAVLLSAEYVIEIAHDLLAALPDLPSEPYRDFVRQNRSLMRTLRSRATSYWDCYYRAQYPDKTKFPGLYFFMRSKPWPANLGDIRS
jgi:hypothetical protein